MSTIGNSTTLGIFPTKILPTNAHQTEIWNKFNDCERTTFWPISHWPDFIVKWAFAKHLSNAETSAYIRFFKLNGCKDEVVQFFARYGKHQGSLNLYQINNSIKHYGQYPWTYFDMTVGKFQDHIPPGTFTPSLYKDDLENHYWKSVPGPTDQELYDAQCIEAAEAAEEYDRLSIRTLQEVEARQKYMAMANRRPFPRLKTQEDLYNEQCLLAAETEENLQLLYKADNDRRRAWYQTFIDDGHITCDLANAHEEYQQQLRNDWLDEESQTIQDRIANDKY
jgi:hypothetical protein